jgi:predicted nucleic acid-binding protein
LRDAADAMRAGELAGRVIAFDENAARHYATLVAARDASGRPISAADAQIAAICREHEAVLATRNGKDFEATGVTVIDPWMAI